MKKPAPQGETPAADWAAFLATTELLRGTAEASLQAIAAEMELLPIKAGETLIRQGDPGDSFYIIVHGRLRAVLQPAEGAEQLLREMQPGESIGEIALLTGQARTATVYALEDSQVLRLAQSTFARLATSTPAVAKQIEQKLLDQIRRRHLRNALKTSHLFQHLDEALLRDLEAEVTWVALVSGEKLVRQGEVGDSMYVVVSGRLRIVQQRDDGIEHILREVGRGESIGAIALLTEEERTATAYAIRDSEVACLAKAGFDRLLTKYPQAMTRTFTRGLVEIIASYESKRTRTNTHDALTIAILPAHPDLPLEEFARRLTQGLAALGPTLHLSSAKVDHLLGENTIAQDDPAVWDATDVRLVSWLSEQEAEHHYVVYAADPTLTAWTQRCLRQADHVLIVGQANHDPQPGPLEVALQALEEHASRKQKSLVLLHRDSTTLPVGTARWLALRQVDQHHHVRWQRAADFARLARRVTGRAVGLVLGGGGIRGMAHLGALRALEEAGMAIDIIGGVSVGAIVAGVYAMGESVQASVQRLQALFATTPIDFTLPIVALSTGRVQNEMCQAIFGERTIEDLWLPFFCLSTNLTRAEEVVHRTGLLWRGVRASNSAPGILPPMVEHGELLVDGALLNNLPIDIMRQFCGSGTVIAVDVTPPVDLTTIAPQREVVSGWQALWDRVNPWSSAGTLPNITALLYRAGEVGSVHALKKQVGQRLADLYLRPPVENFGMMEARAFEQIVELGYHYTRDQLALWQNKPYEQNNV